MHSLISEYFPASRRALALSSLSVAGTIGASLSYLLGGAVAQYYGWRAAFFLAGAPGIIVSALLFLLLRDPGRGGKRASDAPTLPLRAALGKLWQRRSFVSIVIGMSLAAISTNAGTAWKPTFYQRVFGMSLTETGAWLSASQLLTGFLGVLLGGWLADRFYKRDRRSSLWIMAISVGGAPVLGLVTFLVRDATVSLIALQFYVLFSGLWGGPYAALQQGLAGPSHRATATAVAIVCATFLGFSLGPLIAGSISDWLEPSFGKDSLRYGLAFSMLFSLWGLVHLLLASRKLVADMDEAASEA